MDNNIRGCSSPLYKMTQCLHITYICIQTTAGYAYTSLQLCRISIVLGVQQIQVLLFETFWDHFFANIFEP